MKFLAFICLAFWLTACKVSAPTNLGNEQNALENRTLILFYDNTLGTQALEKEITALNAEVIYRYANFNGLALRLPESVALEAAITRLRQTQGVLSVETDGKVSLQ